MTYEDVLNFCEEEDVRFIRLCYFDGSLTLSFRTYI